MYPNKDYTRIGGWLLVFVVWSVIQIAANLFSGIELLATMPFSALLALVGHGCLRTAVLVLLFRRNRVCTKLFAAEAAVTVVEIVTLLVQVLPLGADAAYVVSLLFGSSIGNILFYVCWLFYFQRSVRVNVYFSGVDPMPPYGAPGWPPYGYGQQPMGGCGAPYHSAGFTAPPPVPDGTVRYCPRCGRPVENSSALFCAGCGTPLHAGKEREQ